MKLIKCGHCGRPFYDKEKACPYCGHAFDSLQPDENRPPLEGVGRRPGVVRTRTDKGERRIANPTEQECNIDTPANSPSSVLHSPFPTRGESIAAITESQSQPSVLNSLPENDPNQIETTYPPRKRRVWLWVVIILLVLALAAAAYFLMPHLGIKYNQY